MIINAVLPQDLRITATPTFAGLILSPLSVVKWEKTAELYSDVTLTHASPADFVFAGLRYLDFGTSILKTSGYISTTSYISVDAGILCLGSSTSYSIPSGPGVRFLWIPHRSALRAGFVTGTQWDAVNIGNQSFAVGYNTTASGDYSAAFGDGTIASYFGAVAMGRNSTATKQGAFAAGSNCQATGDFSVAMGQGATASGSYSVAMGGGGTQAGYSSLATGYVTHAKDYGSFAHGFNFTFNKANFYAGNGSSYGALAIGYCSNGNKHAADGTGSAVIGQDVYASTNANIIGIGKGFSIDTAQSFNVGFGAVDFQVQSAVARVNGILEILKTTKQASIKYDASNYFDITVNSTGSTTFALTGTGPLFNFSKGVNVTGIVQLGDGGTTDYSKFEANGTLEFFGAATVWEDLRIEPVVRGSGTRNPAFTKWYDDSLGTSRGVYLYDFTNEAVNEVEIFFTMQLPHAWKGTAIKLHVHWVGASTSPGNAKPKWGCEYCWKDIGEVYGDTVIITKDTNTAGDAAITANKHYITAFDSITPGTTADGISSVLMGRIFRNSSDAGDTYDDKVGLLYIDAHYEINTCGSRDEFIK